MVTLEDIVNEARLSRCSDVHLSEGEPPSFRMAGVLLRKSSLGRLLPS